MMQQSATPRLYQNINSASIAMSSNIGTNNVGNPTNNNSNGRYSPIQNYRNRIPTVRKF